MNNRLSNVFVQELLDDVRQAFHIGEDQAPGGVDGTTREMLTLHHAGADLSDDWIIADLGLAPGQIIILKFSFGYAYEKSACLPAKKRAY